MMTQLTDTLWTLKFLWCYFVWDRIPVGTKSVLFGAHQFILHPLAVAKGWTHFYGFPFDPRFWMAFFLHDAGYIGKPNMDGPEGQTHPEFGARLMQRLFDRDRFGMGDTARYYWHDMCLFHSRSYSKKNGANPSPLCHADKIAFCYQIKWLYLLGVKLTGEIDEYMENAASYNEEKGYTAIRCDTPSNWYDDMWWHMASVATDGYHKTLALSPSM